MKNNKKRQKHKKTAAETRKTRPAPRPVHAAAARPGDGHVTTQGPTGATSERLYTAEEIGAKYGITVDEVMAIAGRLGIRGDPRYGRWVPPEPPPGTSEVRSGTIDCDTPSGPKVPKD